MALPAVTEFLLKVGASESTEKIASFACFLCNSESYFIVKHSEGQSDGSVV